MIQFLYGVTSVLITETIVLMVGTWYIKRKGFKL